MKHIKFFAFILYVTVLTGENTFETVQWTALCHMLSPGMTVAENNERLVLQGNESAITQFSQVLSARELYKKIFPLAAPFSVDFKDQAPDSWSSFLCAMSLRLEDAGYVYVKSKDEEGGLIIDCTKLGIGLMAQGYIQCLKDNHSAFGYFSEKIPHFIREKNDSGKLTEVLIHYAAAAGHFALSITPLDNYEKPKAAEGAQNPEDGTDWVEVGTAYVEVNKDALCRRLAMLNGGDKALNDYFEYNVNYRIAKNIKGIFVHQIKGVDGQWVTIPGSVEQGKKSIDSGSSLPARKGLDDKWHIQKHITDCKS
jgi:hypothetical protein